MKTLTLNKQPHQTETLIVPIIQDGLHFCLIMNVDYAVNKRTGKRTLSVTLKNEDTPVCNPVIEPKTSEKTCKTL